MMNDAPEAGFGAVKNEGRTLRAQEKGNASGDAEAAIHTPQKALHMMTIPR